MQKTKKKKINKVYEEDKEVINNNDLYNNIINTNNKLVFDKIIKEKNNLNNLVDNLKNQIKTLKNEKELNEKKNKETVNEIENGENNINNENIISTNNV